MSPVPRVILSVLLVFVKWRNLKMVCEAAREKLKIKSVLKRLTGVEEDLEAVGGKNG